MGTTYTLGQWLLGADPLIANLLGVAARAALIFLTGYAMIRIGEHRFVGKNTAFDVVLGFIFGSTLSRAINGEAAFLETFVACAVMLGLHWMFTYAASRSERLDSWLNGEACQLVEEGRVNEEVMRANRITPSLLRENMRMHGGAERLDEVRSAYFERNGMISVLSHDRDHRVLEVEVEEGVQTVRVELHEGATTGRRG